MSASSHSDHSPSDNAMPGQLQSGQAPGPHSSGRTAAGKRRRYSLHITISTLFISLTLVIGGLLSWQTYQGASAIMLDAADDLRERVRQQLAVDIRATYGALHGGLSQFRYSDVAAAGSFDERIAHLPVMRAILDADSSVFALGVGYPDGDYIGFTSVESAYVKNSLKPVPGSAYVLTYLNRVDTEAEFDTGKQYSIFYDTDLHELARTQGTSIGYDPRQRPWYVNARRAPSTTRPYVFFNSGIVGLSAMSLTDEPGVVVMFDISLEHLSETISRFQGTPDTEVVLVTERGDVLAYARDETAVVYRADDKAAPTLASLNQLGSPVLSALQAQLDVNKPRLDFEFNDRQWVGSYSVVARPGGRNLYALVVTPLDELLADAIDLQWQQVLTALAVLLFFVPVIWFIARRIAMPLQLLAGEASAISRFDFSRTPPPASVIKEVDELDSAMEMMKHTINRFIELINALAGEQKMDALLKGVTRETMQIINANAVLVYLLDDREDIYRPYIISAAVGGNNDVKSCPAIPGLNEQQLQLLADAAGEAGTAGINLDHDLLPMLPAELETTEMEYVPMLLRNRNEETTGLLMYLFTETPAQIPAGSVDFVRALSGFAAVSLESRQLLRSQQELLDAFIRLIAGAIDAKSPYTGGHCQRVPEITLMLARAATDSNEAPFSNFQLDDEQWQELSIACWLHDCGKVTTPEYVVDKATKLETIYDRIHEIRMRFEVLKRDAQVECWRHIAEGDDMAESLAKLEQQHRQLDDDFAFIAECNVGGEFMSDERIERLAEIAKRSWLRTIDDRLGLSWEELQRKPEATAPLPVEEPLIADKAEHVIVRNDNDRMPEDNPWGFRVDTPEHKFNRGELYSLGVRKGTLTNEERYVINGHMIETIKMLNELPFPRRYKDVPLIAGSHHETMDGTGYPKKLVMSEQPLTARMMVIADIFEALTAADRPYKKAKTLSESLRIMSFMRNDKHFDADLFELFLRSGVYLDYANKFLQAEQIDTVNINDYL